MIRPPPAAPVVAKGMAAFQEPVLDPTWALVPDGEEDLRPLPGEGIVEPELLAIERKGNGVLFNAIHRDATAQRASKNIIEAIRAIKQMNIALRGTGNENKVQAREQP